MDASTFFQWMYVLFDRLFKLSEEPVNYLVVNALPLIGVSFCFFIEKLQEQPKNNEH